MVRMCSPAPASWKAGEAPRDGVGLEQPEKGPGSECPERGRQLCSSVDRL